MPDLIDTDGRTVALSSDQDVANALSRGWRMATTADSLQRSKEAAHQEDYGGVAGGAKALYYGALRGATLGLSDVGLRALGTSAGTLKGYQEENPGLSTAAELAGAFVPSFAAPESLLGRTPAGAVSHIGRSIVDAAEAGGAGVLGKAVASTAGAAAEGALYGGGSYLSQTAIDDKPLAAEGFLGAMGKGALWAAPVGGALSLGESALIRARSLFPRAEMTKQAARAVDRDATSAISQSMQDGQQMAQKARQQIALTEAKIGSSQATEQMTRSMFGAADDSALQNQVTGAAEHSELSNALKNYETSNAAFEDWIRTEADPDLERSLLRLRTPNVQDASAPNLRAIQFDEGVVPPPVRDPRLGSFTGDFDPITGVRRGADGTPGPHEPPRVPITTDLPPMPLASQDLTRMMSPGEVGHEFDPLTKNSFSGGVPEVLPRAPSPEIAAKADEVAGAPHKPAAPMTDDEYQTYKKTYTHAADTHMQHEFFYSKGGDELVNPALRSGKPLDGPAAKLRDGLDAAFKEPESRLPRDTELYRGVSDNPVMGITGVKKRFANVKPGDVLDADPAYTSTTYDPKAKSRNEEIVFTIHAPAGTPALPIRSQFSGEREMLLPRDVQFRVDSIEIVPVSDRWHMEREYEVLPDKSVKVVERNGSISIHKPIKDIHVTILNKFEPPAVVTRHAVDLSAPIDKLSKRQVSEYQDLLNKKFDVTPRDTPEYQQLVEKWDASAARSRALGEGKIEDPPEWAPEVKESAKAPAPATDTLTGQMRSMQERLAGGESLKDLGAPARAEFAALKAEKSTAAAEHFRAKAVTKAAPTADDSLEALLRGTKEQLDAGIGMRDMGTPGASRAVAAEAKAAPAIEAKVAEGAPKGLPEIPAGPKRATLNNIDDFESFFGKDWSKAAPEEQLAEARAMGGQHFGGSRDVAKTIVDGSMKDAMRGVVEDDAISAALRKHNGKNVDIGQDLAKAARVIGDRESAMADLADLLGADAPVMAAQNAKAFRAAMQAQAEKSGASAARAASDFDAKGGQQTLIDSDITKTLRAHDSKAEAGAQRATVSLTKGETKEAAKEAAKPRGALSVAADVGTALELLHAMGVHTPDLSAIPVIGPVLSLYLKARAVLGVMGRKGGSIGRSTEGVIASKASAIRDRIAKAIPSMLDVGAKAARRAAPIAGPAGALAYKLFPGDGDTKSKDPRVLYDARMTELARAQQPGAIDQAVSDRVRTSDPELQNALTAQAQRAVDFLASKAPQKPLLLPMLPGDGKWHPSKTALDQWARYAAAVHDPAGVLEDLANGHVTSEGAETLRVVYPALYAEAQRRLLEHAVEYTKTLPYARRVSLSIMFRVPVDGSMSAQHVAYIAGPHPAPAGAPVGPAPGGGGAPALTAPLSLGQQTMTSVDRRAGM